VQSTLSFVTQLLVPVVTGLVAALGLVLKEWQMAHNRQSVRAQALAEANAQVAFASEWWKAHQLLGHEAMAGAATQALLWLGEAEARVADTRHLGAQERDPVTLKKLFLLHPMRRWSGRILKALFLLCVVTILLGLSATIAHTLATGDTSYLFGDIGAVPTLSLLALVFRALAGAADATPTADPHPVAPATAPSKTPTLITPRLHHG